MCWENTLSAILNGRLFYSNWFTFIIYINQFPNSLTFLFLYKYILGKSIGFRILKSLSLFLGEKGASFAEFLHIATTIPGQYIFSYCCFLSSVSCVFSLAFAQYLASPFIESDSIELFLMIQSQEIPLVFHCVL